MALFPIPAGWLSEHATDAPSVEPPGLECSVWNPRFCRPFHQREGDSIVLDVKSSAATVALLGDRGPAAVVWFVVAIIVDAVDAMPRGWLASHVFKKRLKNQPPLAHRNAATTVAGVVDCRTGSTSLSHFHPRFVLGRLCDLRRLAVAKSAFCRLDNLRVKAPAAKGRVTDQIVGFDNLRLTTRAAAVPHVATSASPSCKRLNIKSPELRASEVTKIHVGW